MNYNTVVSQKDQEELIRLRDCFDMIQWRVGDIANKNYLAFKETQSFSYVCSAVGFYVGRAGTTIQKWARVAGFYNEAWRKKYEGLLSFEHYATAMVCPDWQERLERAACGGRNEEPMSVDEINAKVYVEPSSPSEFPNPPAVVINNISGEPTIKMIGKLENSVATVFNLIRKIIESFQLSEKSQSKVNQALTLLQEAFFEETPEPQTLSERK